MRPLDATTPCSRVLAADGAEAAQWHMAALNLIFLSQTEPARIKDGLSMFDRLEFSQLPMATLLRSKYLVLFFPSRYPEESRTMTHPKQ